MPDYAETIRQTLTQGVATPSQLIDSIKISQPTLSRQLRALGDDVVRIGKGKSIQYALRDRRHGLPEMPVYRVDSAGKLLFLGQLLAIYPQGFVMQEASGRSVRSDDLPWWLYDMRPQGYLGRAWARQHAQRFDFPEDIRRWADHHVLRALLADGVDMSGDLLIGEACRARFLHMQAPEQVEDKARRYPELAAQAATGELAGSSAGGEQPKFTAYTADGHVIVKFSEAEAGPVSERWRDLLLAEYWALATLRASGFDAAASAIIDSAAQRFLESRRFDRVGATGRVGLHSLTALDLQFTGNASEGWVGVTRALAQQGVITPAAAERAALLWAFGTLIGNSDMHGGNLSFIDDGAPPYRLAPVYDMTAMAFAPTSGGGLPAALPALTLRADITPAQWRQALDLARQWLAQLQADERLSARFAPCIQALERHHAGAAAQLARLAV